MAKGKIATTLSAALHYIPERSGTRRDAEAELRALLGVIRAVARHHRSAGGYPWRHIEQAMVRARALRPDEVGID